MGKIDRMLDLLGYQEHFNGDAVCATCSRCECKGGELLCTNPALLEAIDDGYGNGEVSVSEDATCNDYWPNKEMQEATERERKECEDKKRSLAQELCSSLAGLLALARNEGWNGELIDNAEKVLAKARGEVKE